VAIEPADLPGLEALLVYDSRLSRAAIKALREPWGERLRVGAPRWEPAITQAMFSTERELPLSMRSWAPNCAASSGFGP